MVTLKPDATVSNAWVVVGGSTAHEVVQTNDGSTSYIQAEETPTIDCVLSFPDMPADFVLASNIVVRVTAAFEDVTDGVTVDCTINIGGDLGATNREFQNELSGYLEKSYENTGWAQPWDKTQMNGFTLKLQPVQDNTDDSQIYVTMVEVDVYYSTEGLKKGLVSYWAAEDESVDDPKLDSYSDNHIPMAGSVDKVTGKLGLGAFDYTDANDRLEFLLTQVPPELSRPNDGFTICQWVKIDNKTNGHQISNLWRSSGLARRAWALAYVVATDLFQAWFSTDGISIVTLPSSVTPITVGQWYFIATWHDPDANELGIYVNGTTDTIVHTGGLFDPNGDSYFTIGGSRLGVGAMNGQLDEIAYFNIVKTTAELDQIYNNGEGLPLDQWGVAMPKAMNHYRRRRIA